MQDIHAIASSQLPTTLTTAPARRGLPPSLCLRSANRPHVAARSARASLDRRTARGRHTCGGVRAGVRAMKHEWVWVLLRRVLAEMGCVFRGTFRGTLGHRIIQDLWVRQRVGWVWCAAAESSAVPVLGVCFRHWACWIAYWVPQQSIVLCYTGGTTVSLTGRWYEYDVLS